jgi:hypothetical protein
MNKYIVMISLSFSVVLAGFRLLPIAEPPAYARLIQDPATSARQAKYLDEQIRAHDSFIAIQDGILERLARGKLSLPQACDQLYEDARSVYPRGLAFLRKVAGNMDLKRKMACNLVDFFRLEAEGNHSFYEVAARLEQELTSKSFRDWCAQSWVGEPALP